MDVNLGIIITNQSWEEGQDLRLDAQVLTGGHVCLAWSLWVQRDGQPRLPEPQITSIISSETSKWFVFHVIF